MTTSSAPRGGRNPFSTRFVRPGAVPFVFPTGHSAAGTVQRLEGLAWRGQIVGPHGAGKSTLVASLVEPLRRAGRAARVFVLRDGQRRMPAEWVEQARAAAARAIVVDGYEQLSRTSRWRLKACCRRERWGLLVTAHHDVGFPTLARISPNLAVAQAVVDLLMPHGRGAITRDTVAESFAENGGNLRETLFALYDRHERLGAQGRTVWAGCAASAGRQPEHRGG